MAYLFNFLTNWQLLSILLSLHCFTFPQCLMVWTMNCVDFQIIFFNRFLPVCSWLDIPYLFNMLYCNVFFLIFLVDMFWWVTIATSVHISVGIYISSLNQLERLKVLGLAVTYVFSILRKHQGYCAPYYPPAKVSVALSLAQHLVLSVFQIWDIQIKR